MAIGTERKVRVELTPEPRALFAFVGPVGRVGRRRHGTRLPYGTGSLPSSAQTRELRSVIIVNTTVLAIDFFTKASFQ